MLFTYIEAMCALYPRLAIELKDPNDISTLIIQNTPNVQIDHQLLNSWIQEKNELEPIRLMKKERDKRLQEVDWIVSRAYSKGEPVSDEWAAYMQALRDLPDTSKPSLNVLGILDMSSVNWPIKPNS